PAEGETKSDRPRKHSQDRHADRPPAQTARPAAAAPETDSADRPAPEESRPAEGETRSDRPRKHAQDRRADRPPAQTARPAARAPEAGSADRPAAEGSRPARSRPPAELESTAEGDKKRRRRRRRPATERIPETDRAEEALATEPLEIEEDLEAESFDDLSESRNRRKERLPERERREVPPFGELVLSYEMLEALADAGYQDPTPVQAGLIPKALEGRDLMGQARTGTGKTAAFAIPLLEKFGSGEKRNRTMALILVPTRELAVQVRDEIVKLSGHRRVSTVAVYGGKPIRGQIEHLRRGAELVVGTPGRVIDLIDRRALDLAGVECVVLDEADRMLDIGFRPDIEKILRRCPQSRQTLLFSATLPPPVKRLAERYMRDPEMLDFSPLDVAVETIEQFYFTVDPRQKFDLLMQLIERENPKQAIVFCRTKKGTDRVGLRLSRKLPGTAMIHGDLQQRQRDRVMADFRAGNVRFLVATDVVGRGIDVSGISHIINFDIPEFCDDYIHRVGRTGRMGREGVAYTFVSPDEGNELTRIEMRINRLLIRDEMPGFLAVPRPEATPETPAEPAAEAAKPKTVFGKWTRRIRRAL
ncbi:MAG: DEAD/DEAH box helicase, partial [Thermoguttaceae bacterium]